MLCSSMHPMMLKLSNVMVGFTDNSSHRQRRRIHSDTIVGLIDSSSLSINKSLLRTEALQIGKKWERTAEEIRFLVSRLPGRKKLWGLLMLQSKPLRSRPPSPNRQQSRRSAKRRWNHEGSGFVRTRTGLARSEGARVQDG